jgi:hypothetical protein
MEKNFCKKYTVLHFAKCMLCAPSLQSNKNNHWYLQKLTSSLGRKQTGCSKKKIVSKSAVLLHHEGWGQVRSGQVRSSNVYCLGGGDEMHTRKSGKNESVGRYLWPWWKPLGLESTEFLEFIAIRCRRKVLHGVRGLQMSLSHSLQ